VAHVEPPRIPLILTQENRDETTKFDARIINAYVEKDQSGDVWVVKRPGLVINSSIGASTGRGIYNWRQNVYSIRGATLYKDATPVAGTVDTTNGVYTFSACLGATPKLFFQNGVKAYTYDSGGGLVQVTDAQYPSTAVKGAAYLDGTMYVMDIEGNIYGSDFNDPQSWTALNLIKAQVEHDQGIAIAKQLVYVIAFKEWSTEIFYDAANAAGSPLAPVQGGKLSYGCRTAESVQDMDGVLFWVSATRSGAVGVMRMENIKSQTISTPSIERLLQGVDFSVVYSWNAKRNGHKFYGITFKNSSLTLVYDDTTGEWAQWTDPAVVGNYMSIVSSTITVGSQESLLQDESDGHIYTLEHSAYNDEGQLFTVDIYTPNYDAKTKKGKTVNKLYPIADQTAGSVLQVRYSDDDYETWSNFIEVDLSQEAPYIPDMGTFKRRAHHLRHHCNTAFRIKYLEWHGLLGVL
jgi:hypothetical protein